MAFGKENSLKSVIAVLVAVSIIMVLLISGNNTLLTTLAVYIAMTIICILAYLLKSDIRPTLIGIKKNNLIMTIILGLGMTFLFYIIAQITGLSIGLPRLPGAISDSVRQIVVLGFAPIIESVFFQSIVFSFLLVLTKNKWMSIVGQAVVFAFAHLGAYVSGFYSYPTLPAGLLALGQNLGSFISAFLFAFLCMVILTNKKVDNLAFAMVFHFGLNLVISVFLSVVFL